MTDLYVKGPDAIRLLSGLGVNSFANFAVDKAKQFVAVNPDGYVIGDAILFYLDENLLSLVGRPSAHNWVQYHGETGGYDVTFERDERSAVNPKRAQGSTASRCRARRRSRCCRRRTAARCPRSSSSTWAS